jgi:hypothetical protein
MADTNFVDGQTQVVAAWLNDVNDSTYGPTAPLTTLRGQLADTSSASNGAGLSGFNQALDYPDDSVGRKLNEYVSIMDFGADNTGVALCNTALDLAKAKSTTVYLPRGTYRLEGYNLQGMRLVGDTPIGANYGVWNTVIEGSGDIFTDANNFSLYGLVIRNSTSGTAGKLLQIKDIDTGIGPIENCVFLKATHHIYHSSATRTIVGAAIRGCLFREATVYSRYYANQGLFQYSEYDCYTTANGRGMFIQSTSTGLIAASVFEFNDEGAVYVVNTASASPVIRGLKFQNVHFEGNGAVTPSSDITMNVTPSLSRLELDCCGFYSPSVASTVDLTGCADARVYEHECIGVTYGGVGAAKIVQVNAVVAGETSGVRVTGSDIKAISGRIVGNGGFTAGNGLAVTITGSATPTPVPAPGTSAATMVLVRDTTTNGVGILMLTPSTVTVVASTLATITFTIVAGFLNGQTTGGASSRTLFFNYFST